MYALWILRAKASMSPTASSATEIAFCEGVKATITILHEWFSDFELTIVKIAADGDTVWSLNRARGVNTGSVMGFPPTGKSFEIDMFDVARFEDGKIVEHWGVPDQLGLLIQLGLMQRPQPVGVR